MNDFHSPNWKRIFIQSKVPRELAALERISRNLWWSWNHDAKALFRQVDPALWEKVGHNPIALLDATDYQRYEALLKDAGFLKSLEEVSNNFEKYIAKKPEASTPKIAYFCMEYGLHSSLKLYSGGLGVLAGDFLKEASDSNVSMVGIGLLYRYGYFRQELSLHGDQIAHYDAQRFTHLPVEPVKDADGQWIKISIDLPQRTLFAKVWKASVGRIPLYLLDTDIDENNEHDRSITHQLYGGDQENRLKQEILLGIGGIRMLEAVGFTPDVYHLNEGHAAFISLERLRKLIQEKELTYLQAVEVVRSTSLFTTHTPVPAGHDTFHEDMLWPYMSEVASSISLSWEKFMGLGRIDPDNKEEVFSMSHLACHLSQEVNGVSRLHGSVSREMFKPLYPGYEANELHIGYVTNSVHYYTWTSKAWQQLYKNTFGDDFLNHQSDAKQWKTIHEVPDDDIRKIRLEQKEALIQMVKDRLELNMRVRHENPKRIIETLNALNGNSLMFGFARRFATYKRAQLLFTDEERLAKIVNNPKYPVQFLFAGKAHPADKGGQAIIKRINEISSRPEFLGKIIFLEDYDMELATKLVQGVDVWLNTPTRPLEASGTSGMKATMNGVLNFSVLDGWWAEGYLPEAGWALTEERIYENQDFQNELDAETIYSMLEHEIIPEYYNAGKENISAKWIQRIKHTIARVAPVFTMKRMMDDYMDKFYGKLHERSALITQQNFQNAKALAEWKEKVSGLWNTIEVIDKDVYDADNHPLPLGEAFKAAITLDLKTLNPEDVGVELVFAKRQDGKVDIVATHELEKKKVEEKVLNTAGGEDVSNEVTYECEVKAAFAGVFEYGFRIYAKNPMLPHKQDFNLVRWL